MKPKYRKKSITKKMIYNLNIEKVCFGSIKLKLQKIDSSLSL